MARRAIAGLVALVLLGGCGGGGDDPGTHAGPAPRPDARVRDAALGYSLLLPTGWRAAEVPPGQAVPLAGGGAGCAVGPAGTLGDVQGRRLVEFARATARRRATAGAKVSVASVSGANAPGALVKITKGDAGARSAVFASAGGGVAITCRGTTQRMAAVDRGLSLLLTSVRLRRDPVLERLQPSVVRVPGVQGATLRRNGSRVEARITVSTLRDGANRLQAVVARIARAVPSTDVAVNASAASNPNRVAYARFLGGTRAGTVQVPPAAPRRFALD